MFALASCFSFGFSFSFLKYKEDMIEGKREILLSILHFILKV